MLVGYFFCVTLLFLCIVFEWWLNGQTQLNKHNAPRLFCPYAAEGINIKHKKVCQKLNFNRLPKALTK